MSLQESITGALSCSVCGARIDPVFALAGGVHSCAPALLKRIEALEAALAVVATAAGVSLREIGMKDGR